MDDVPFCFMPPTIRDSIIKQLQAGIFQVWKSLARENLIPTPLVSHPIKFQ